MHSDDSILGQYKALVHKYSDTIKMVAYRYYPNGGFQYEALLCDLTTHLWEVYTQKPAGMDDEAEKSWVYVVLTNKARNLMRNEQLYHSLIQNCETLPETADEGRSPQVERLYELIDRLGGNDRKLLEMYLKGYHIAEIADHLGKSQVYVFRQMDRIRKRLRELNKIIDNR